MWTVITLYLLSGTMATVRAADAEPDVWPQWRGPSRDARCAESVWPTSLQGEHLVPSWRVELGPSYSGPIVAQDRVFVTETRDRTDEVVRALDRHTGQELWATQWPGAMKVPFFAASNGSWIRATPALDENRLYVAGMRDVLVCLDTKNGQELWRVDFVATLGTPLPAFGFVSSPLVLGDHVFVQAAAGLVKLDKRTGAIVWRSLEDNGGMMGSAFSSPYLAPVAGTPTLLVQTRTTLAGVDPESGAVWWQQPVEAFRGMNILTPTLCGEGIFTSSYGGRSHLFAVSRSGDGWQVQESWNNKLQGYMSTPIIHHGHIYLHLRNQRFACIDATTGQERWTTKPFGKYWSMVANGDKILALDQQGELLLIEASPDEFRLLDRRQIAEDSWAHLAVCGEEVFVRELNAMSAYRWK